MRIRISLALCLMAALLLVGCAPDDAGKTAKLIDPATNGSVVTGEAPSAGWPIESMGRNIYSASQTDTKYTDVMEWNLVGDLFTSEELNFVVPSQWRGNFDLRISTQISGILNMRAFAFYFIEHETGLEVEILRISAVQTGRGLNIERLGGEILGESIDGDYAYLRMAISVEPGEAFESGQLVYDILKILESDGFKIEIVA